MKVELTRITVGHPINGNANNLFVWVSVEQANEAVAYSPTIDPCYMSATTYHRHATVQDVARLRYDRNGEEITL